MSARHSPPLRPLRLRVKFHLRQRAPSRSIVRRYSKTQPALFRLAAAPIFSDFSPFTGFIANRRSVDMLSAACPILIMLPSSPNGAPASGEDRSPLPNAHSQPPGIRSARSRRTRYEAPPVNRSLAVHPPRGFCHRSAVHVRLRASVETERRVYALTHVRMPAERAYLFPQLRASQSAIRNHDCPHCRGNGDRQAVSGSRAGSIHLPGLLADMATHATGMAHPR